MSELDTDKIRRIAEGHESPVSPDLWSRVEDKLEHRSAQKRTRRYRNLAIAASLTTLICSMTILAHIIDHHNPAVFATNEDHSPMQMELLTVEEGHPYYTVESVHELNSLYAGIFEIGR